MLAYMLSLLFMFLLAQFFSYHWASPHVVEWCLEMWPVLMLTNNWRWDPVLLPTATNNPNSSGGHRCWLPECAAHITTDDAWHWLDAVCCNPGPDPLLVPTGSSDSSLSYHPEYNTFPSVQHWVHEFKSKPIFKSNLMPMPMSLN